MNIWSGMERACHDAITVRLSRMIRIIRRKTTGRKSFFLTLFSTFLCHRTISFHVPFTFFSPRGGPLLSCFEHWVQHMLVDGVGRRREEGGGDGKAEGIPHSGDLLPSFVMRGLPQRCQRYSSLCRERSLSAPLLSGLVATAAQWWSWETIRAEYSPIQP